MNFVKACGIYTIQNDITGRIYLGSSVNLKARAQTHIRELRKGVHVNTHLQNSWNKYGEDAFSFRTIIECEPDELESIEGDLLTGGMVGDSNCFNICIDPRHPTRGRKLSEEHKRKIGAANAIALKGRKATEEHRKNQSMSQVGLLKGRKLSVEHKAKLSDAKKGKSAYWNKKPKSEETKKKLSEVIKAQYTNGRSPWNKGKKKTME